MAGLDSVRALIEALRGGNNFQGLPEQGYIDRSYPIPRRVRGTKDPMISPGKISINQAENAALAELLK
jgi:hypothetical protein